MLQRVREAMKRGKPVESMRGIVVAETCFSGRFKDVLLEGAEVHGWPVEGGPYRKTAVLSVTT